MIGYIFNKVTCTETLICKLKINTFLIKSLAPIIIKSLAPIIIGASDFIIIGASDFIKNVLIFNLQIKVMSKFMILIFQRPSINF